MPLSRARSRRLLALAAALVAAALAVPPAARAADEDAVLRLRAVRLAADGRCDEALPLLDRVLEANPGDARAALVAGQCQLRLKRYPAAVAKLEQAQRLDPSLPDVPLQLGIARFHQGDLNGSEAALAAAAARDPERAELKLYQGLLLLQRADSREAALALDRARLADPQQVEPLASYYAGLAWAGADERDRAEESLRRVSELAPGTVWAQEAERALDRMRAGGPATWWLVATAGLEYDDNVVLRAHDVVLPNEISSQHDIRGVWYLNVGTEFLRRRDWSAGALLSYKGTAHQDLSDFNEHYPVASLWLDRRLGEDTTARLQYEFGYAWFQGDPFLAAQAVTPALHHTWGEAGSSRLFTRLYRYNYLFGNQDVPDGVGAPFDACPGGIPVCGPPGLNEESARNRDGQGLAAGLEHTIPLGFTSSELSGGYTYHRYSSRGSEYSFQGHELHTSARIGLPLEFVLGAGVSYTYRPYRNRSTFPDPNDVFFGLQYALENERRSDDAWRFEAGLSRALGKGVTAAVRYGYYKNHSNVAVFDYDREILGVYLTLRLEP